MRATRAKRALVGTAVGAMVLGLLPTGAAFADIPFDEVCEGAESAGFTDVGTTHRDAINCMASYDVIFGTSPTTYGTQTNISRQQFASLVARFARTADPDLAVNTSTSPFTDVTSSTHRPNINALFNLGIIEGTTATTFSPNDNLTRAQAATILFNAAEALGVDFPDDNDSNFTDLGNTHRDAIEALNAAEIFVGKSATIFGYSDPIQRGQIASALARSAQYLLDRGLWGSTLVTTTEFDVALSWINEVDDSGDEVTAANFRQGEPGAEGSATIEVNEFDNTVTFTVEYDDVTGPFDGGPGLHIHEGAIDENGPVVITLATGAELEAEADGTISGTVDGDAFDVSDIVADPEDYYVNLHSDDFRGGAIRGQLPDGGQDLIPDAPALPATVTDGPELVSFSVESQMANTLIGVYTFDESVEGNIVDTENNAGLFWLFTANDPISSIRGAAADVDGSQVRVEFPASADDFARVTTATVERDAVTDTDDLQNPEGNVAVKSVTDDVTSGGTTGADLLSIGNFVNEGGLNPASTDVDFVFDADVAVATLAADFSLVLTDGDVLAGTVADEDGDTVTVTFSDGGETVAAADVARGLVGSNVDSPFQANIDKNASVLPDLDSISINESTDRVVYTFDESVRFGDGAQSGTSTTEAAVLLGFTVYDADGVEINTGTEAAISGANNNVVTVQFMTDLTDDHVGASVDEDTVLERFGDRRGNVGDEARLAASSEQVTTAAGETAGPDLLSVSAPVDGDTDLGGNVTNVDVTFTFNEDLDPLFCDAAFFHLYEVDGTRIDGASAECGEGDADSNEAIVTFDATADSPQDAVLGTVSLNHAGAGSNGAVAAEGTPLDPGRNFNPEGAAIIGS